MAHEHPVRDTDLHFVIDPITRAIKNNSGKITLMQYDHQSEIFTFELPRYIDTHDMSICDKVRVHYINIGSSSKYEPVSGVYEITDLQIDPENEDLVTCSWLLTNNTTQLDGTLNFIIRFSCLTGETIDYSWSTAIYSGIVVAKTIDSTDEVMENTADILEQWKASLKGDPFTYEDFTPEQLEGLRGPAGVIVSETEPTNEDHPVWIKPSGEYIVENLGITGASVGQTVKIKAVGENGAPTEWEAADMASGEVKLIASCTLEETASAIEFTGLSVKNKSLSIRIKNTGNSCGNGWQIWVNGVMRNGSTGGTGSTSTYFANNRIWLFPDGSTLRGISQCANGGTNHYNWTNFQGTITSIKLTSAYHSDTSKYYGIGTNVKVYEGILPNIQ